MNQYYDIIADIHGCAAELELLLTKMGYVILNDVYTHPDGRKVIFLGDFIDRGPNVSRVLQIAKSMCDAGSALAVLGNHEYNAVAFHTINPHTGLHLREHLPKNKKQHRKTMDAFKDREEEWQMYIDWFRTLPMYLQIDNLNIIHACWAQDIINLHSQYPLLSDDFLYASAEVDSPAHTAIETLLKGKETPLGFSIKDKEGHERTEMRVKWWLSEEELRQCDNLYQVSLTTPKKARATLETAPFIYEEQKQSFCGLPSGLTFIGHYWFTNEEPIINPHLSCLDFSCVKGGRLVAYRWSGEDSLSESNVVRVDSL